VRQVVGVRVIAASGIRTGGHLATAIAWGADAVMLGRPLAAVDSAPGRGAYWGLAAAHHELPRGCYDRVEPLGPLEVILRGPAHRDDGSGNRIGGLRRAMGITGCEMHADLRGAALAVPTGIA
jgi:IMP dehydrogenase